MLVVCFSQQTNIFSTNPRISTAKNVPKCHCAVFATVSTVDIILQVKIQTTIFTYYFCP